MTMSSKLKIDSPYFLHFWKLDIFKQPQHLKLYVSSYIQDIYNFLCWKNCKLHSLKKDFMGESQNWTETWRDQLSPTYLHSQEKMISFCYNRSNMPTAFLQLYNKMFKTICHHCQFIISYPQSSIQSGFQPHFFFFYLNSLSQNH